MKNSTTRILTIAVILLLLVNATMLYFMLKHHKGDDRNDHPKGGPFEMMVKELNMTEQQQADYKKLKEDHFSAVRPLFDSARAARQAFFALAKDSTRNDSLETVYGNRIYTFQSAADKMILEHFRKVRNLFKDEQQRKFDEFVQKMMQGRGKRDSANRDKH